MYHAAESNPFAQRIRAQGNTLEQATIQTNVFFFLIFLSVFVGSNKLDHKQGQQR